MLQNWGGGAGKAIQGGLSEGLTFNWGDEAGAREQQLLAALSRTGVGRTLGMTPTDVDYDEVVRQNKAERERAAVEHPGLAFGANIAGSIPGAVVSGGLARGIGAATNLPRLASLAGSAGQAGLAGLGGGEPGDRASRGLAGTLLGATLHGAGALGSRYASKGANALRNLSDANAVSAATGANARALLGLESKLPETATGIRRAGFLSPIQSIVESRQLLREATGKANEQVGEALAKTPPLSRVGTYFDLVDIGNAIKAQPIDTRRVIEGQRIVGTPQARGVVAKIQNLLETGNPDDILSAADANALKGAAQDVAYESGHGATSAPTRAAAAGIASTVKRRILEAAGAGGVRPELEQAYAHAAPLNEASGLLSQTGFSPSFMEQVSRPGRALFGQYGTPIIAPLQAGAHAVSRAVPKGLAARLMMNPASGAEGMVPQDRAQAEQEADKAAKLLAGEPQ
jgi:hypothetical protein